MKLQTALGFSLKVHEPLLSFCHPALHKQAGAAEYVTYLQTLVPRSPLQNDEKDILSSSNWNIA